MRQDANRLVKAVGMLGNLRNFLSMLPQPSSKPGGGALPTSAYSFKPKYAAPRRAQLRAQEGANRTASFASVKASEYLFREVYAAARLL